MVARGRPSLSSLSNSTARSPPLPLSCPHCPAAPPVAMALKGKSKQVASDSESEPTRVTRASSSRGGDKRRRGPGDEAEPPSSSVAAKRPRRRCAGDPKAVDDDARVFVEEVEEENQEELQPQGDPGDGTRRFDSRDEHDRISQSPRAGTVLDLEPFLGVVAEKLMTFGEALIPFAPFVRQVMGIADSFSSERLHWKPEALIRLQVEAEDYLLQVFNVGILLVRDVMAHPIPWYDNTRLTQEQEEAVFILSCASCIPVYVRKMTKYDVTGAGLYLSAEYCQLLAPRLGSKRGQIKLFFSDNMTCSEIKYSTEYGNFRLYWHHFTESNCIKEGDTYAFTFEEDEEGCFLSVRMHPLNGMLGSEEYGKERPQRLPRSQEGTLSIEHNTAVRRTASMHIPYFAFVRMVMEITACCSSGYRWSRRALLSLHQAAVKHLASLYEVLNHFATLLTPYICGGTKLTPEEEATANSLSLDCASGIRMYVWTYKGSKKDLVFGTEFSKQYLFPYIGPGRWKAKVFNGKSLTPVEVNFQMQWETKKVVKPRAALYGGWGDFVTICGLKKGDVCACTFEEEEGEYDEECAPLSFRVHLLRAAPR